MRPQVRSRARLRPSCRDRARRKSQDNRYLAFDHEFSGATIDIGVEKYVDTLKSIVDDFHRLKAFRQSKYIGECCLLTSEVVHMHMQMRRSSATVRGDDTAPWDTQASVKA